MKVIADLLTKYTMTSILDLVKIAKLQTATIINSVICNRLNSKEGLRINEMILTFMFVW